jgi:hypothetical protein
LRTLGIATRVSDKTAKVSLVVLQGGCGASFDILGVAVEAEFDLKVDEADLAQQLGTVAEHVRGEVRSIAPDRVVIRRADMPQRASNAEGPRFRLLLEGAITSAAQSQVGDTVLRGGKSCAAVFARNTTRDQLDAHGASLGVQKKNIEAAAAALSALAEE